MRDISIASVTRCAVSWFIADAKIFGDINILDPRSKIMNFGEKRVMTLRCTLVTSNVNYRECSFNKICP